jgi:oligoribonuclease
MLGIFLDIESTGLDVTRHYTIDIAFKIIDLSTGELKATYTELVLPDPEAWENRDPVSMQINGYTLECLAQAKQASQVSEEIIRIFTEVGIERGRAVYICQNPSFDRAFFTKLVNIQIQEKNHWPYHWLDLASMHWAILLHKRLQEGLPIPEKDNLSKNEIARAYGLPPETDPHRAINGVNHLILCYQHVLGIHFSASVL